MPIALVTGASQGIGRAIALRLAEDGMDVAINDIESKVSALDQLKSAIEAKGRRSICVPADVSLENEVEEMVDAVVRHFGELNVMVANAGIVVPKTLFEVSVEEWDRVQAVNVRGPFLCYRKAGKQMIAQGKGGKIIGACSIAAYRSSGNTLPYAVSKWAVRGLTQGVAQELAQYEINVNAYCPGPVATNMWEQIDTSIAEREGLAKGVAFETSIQTRSAMKKASKPEDIAAGVSFLASKNSDMMTGQCIIIDGGIAFA